jgi:hypothetical protein
MSLQGALDMAPIRTAKTVVIGKSISPGKNGATHMLRVTSWRPGSDAQTLPIAREIHHRFDVGESILVEVHSGLFHLPWAK